MIGVRFPAGAGNFSLLHYVQIRSGAHSASYPLSPGVKQLGHESDLSPSSAEVKESMSHTSTSHTSSWHCA